MWILFGLLNFSLFLILDLGFWAGPLQGSESAESQAVVFFSVFFFLGWAIFPSIQDRAIAGGWSIESEVAHYIVYPFVRKASSFSLLSFAGLCGLLGYVNDLFLDSQVEFMHFASNRLEALGIFSTLPFFLGGLIVFRLSGKQIRSLIFDLAIGPVRASISLVGLSIWLTDDLPYGEVWQAVAFCSALYVTTGLLRSNNFLAKSFGVDGKY